MLLYLEYAYSKLYRDVNFLNPNIVLIASLIWNNSVLSLISKLTFMVVRTQIPGKVFEYNNVPQR